MDGFRISLWISSTMALATMNGAIGMAAFPNEGLNGRLFIYEVPKRLSAFTAGLEPSCVIFVGIMNLIFF